MTHVKWVVISVLGLSVTAGAQGGGVAEMQSRQAVEKREQVAENMRMAVRSRIMRGAPYSAETVTEFTQTLGDGNRIVRRTTTRVFRDSEGRTRVEQMNPGGAVSNVNISDPVAGETLVLYPESRTAYRGGVMIFTERVDAAGGGGVLSGSGAVVTVSPGPAGAAVWVEKGAQVDAARKLEKELQERITAGSGAVYVAGGTGQIEAAKKLEKELQARITAGGGGLYVTEGAGKVDAATTREDLGQQSIEGVLTNGTRTTTVIEAGAVGNELPIRIVSEEWYSPDLQLLVLTRHSDPRSGETTFRLTNISRAEPDRSLFTLPSDYTLKESAIRREAR